MVCVCVCVRNRKTEKQRERREYKPTRTDLERFPKWIKSAFERRSEMLSHWEN